MSDQTVHADTLIDPAAVVDALESNRFKDFLDHVPVAIAVSELQPSEVVRYANLEFQRLTGRTAIEIEGKSWRALPGIASADGDERLLRDAVKDDSEYIGVFAIDCEVGTINVDVWSNTIEGDTGEPIYRLVAMGRAADATDIRNAEATALYQKDVQLKELQHRVKNNLQMITSLIRAEARSLQHPDTSESFGRLAGRVNALAVLYDALSHDKTDDQVDLGSYLGQIASAVMQAHATTGIRLDTKIDSWPVSINVALPAGLVVNEVLTNALKHAFKAGEGGIIKLYSLIDDQGCHITISDDGIGLLEGAVWPLPGKLSAVIVQSLKQNAAAAVSVRSAPKKGVSVTISFAKAAAAPANAKQG
ncbi:histidine kinase dimerization/phosphoacceptor domain -containing protein [Tabrizicola sp.]|uniref:sensor histidine kinase n=1 Tax=Tabrizicola sp. TaxID=2005166 RepID=UPI00286A23F1|nr:histidine kinase dimerization/phosphoacceptor domain -containing protein [Tabrizicola sp.]